MNNTVRKILMVVLLAVFLFSGGTVLYVLHQYKVGDALYEGVAETYVRSVGLAAPADGEDPTAPEMTYGAASLRRVTEGGGEEPGGRLADPAPIQVDMAALRADNPDVIGWIYCEDTPINYPVLQGADDDYYLHRSMDGSYSVFGSIFAEAMNRPDFQDGNTIVYGHHMKNGSMFACLENWAKQEYYNKHPVMWLLTEEQDYMIVLASGYTTSAYSDVYTVYQGPSEYFTEYLQQALANSNFVPEPLPEDTGRWVLLSTCAYVFDNARYVLHGMLVPAASAGGVPFEP